MKNNWLYFQFIILSVIISCFNYNKSAKLENNNYDISENIEDTLRNYFKSNGVISFNPTNENISKSIIILNVDNTIYAKIDLLNQIIEFENAKFKLEYFVKNKELLTKYNFTPKEFYPEYYIIQFEINDVHDSIAEIFIDKKNNVIKKININNDMIIVQTWKEHFIGSMIIFDKKTNPIRKYNNDNAESIGYENSYDEYLFIISDIHGEWIQIECSDICGIPCDEKYKGWIRWKRNDKLLIKLAYIC